METQMKNFKFYLHKQELSFTFGVHLSWWNTNNLFELRIDILHFYLLIHYLK